MSLLLDALNKADQERKRGDGPPSIDSRHDGYSANHRSKAPTLIIALCIGIALIVLLAAVYWLGRYTQQPITTIETTVATTEATTAATTKVSPAIDSQKLEPEATQNSSHNIYSKDASTKNISNAETASEDEGVATLYQQQFTTTPEPNATINTPDSTPSTTTPHTTLSLSTAQLSTNQPSTNVPSTTSAPSINQFANLPDLHDLPDSILEKIPTLKYTEHNFNQNGGSVVINGTVKHINDQLGSGIVIDKILADGMILHFENYSFKMRALNTWINM
jgi:general secretion pathway protein B